MKKKILIVASNYYKDITKQLIKNAQKTITKDKNQTFLKYVNGSFEIPVVISQNIKKFDAFIALGCVIKGKTPHFDFICKSTFDGLMYLSILSKKPIGNGIITCLNLKQAKKRSQKKGDEAAKSVLKILKR